MVKSAGIAYTAAMSDTTSVTLLPDKAVYIGTGGELQLDVRIESETVWLTQAQIAELFDATRQNDNLHMLNVYEEEEVDRDSTCKDFLQVRQEGRRTVRRNVERYSLG